MLNTEIKDGGVAFLIYSGPSKTVEMPMLATFCIQRIKEMGGDVRVVVLDMSAVDYINAAGLTCLIQIWRLCQEKSINFKLVSLAKWVKYVLALTRIDTFIPCNT